jgi:hypothetical protein
MVRIHKVTLAAAAMALAACGEQTEQTLPFDPATTTTATGSVGTSGGVVSLASGAQVTVPVGAITGSSSVTLANAATPALPAGSGTPLGSRSFSLTSPGGSLINPVDFEMLVPDVVTNPNGWLADFVVGSGTAAEVEADVSVDLSNGKMVGKISQFGVITPVIPPAEDIVAVDVLPAGAELVADAIAPNDLFTGPVRTISQNCRRGGGAPPCVGFTARASGTLLAQVGSARLTRPAIAGSITLTGDPRVGNGALAAGSLTLRGVVRVRQSGTSAGGLAARIPIRVTLNSTGASRVVQNATTNALTLTGFTVSAAPAFSGVPTSFTIVPTSASTGVFEYRGTVSVGNGVGTVAVRFPFNIGY